MDPNATMARIEYWINKLAEVSGDDLVDVAEELTWAVRDLREWIDNGGFKPVDVDRTISRALSALAKIENATG